MKQTFNIPGEIKGKERPRTTRTGIFYTPKQTKEYEKYVANCYKEQCGYLYEKKIPICMLMDIRVAVPQSKSDRQKERLMNSYPTTKPDIDNIEKIILDGLNKVAYYDDSQVVSVGKTKSYVLTQDEEGVTVILETRKNAIQRFISWLKEKF